MLVTLISPPSLTCTSEGLERCLRPGTFWRESKEINTENGKGPEYVTIRLCLWEFSLLWRNLKHEFSTSCMPCLEVFF
jgi:hypothetical protein